MDSLQENSLELTSVPKLPVEWNIKHPIRLDGAVMRAGHKHALFAQLPMKCTGLSCPYHETCYSLATKEVSEGDRCVPEIATIITETEEYKKALNISEDNFVEMKMMQDLIVCDLMLDRCNKILAIEPMIGMVDKAINKNDTTIQEAAPHVAVILIERIIARKYKILAELNGTRRSKSKLGGAGDQMNISKFMISLKKSNVTKEVG